MRQFDIVRRVRHSADGMYALVADVERYPEFVPLCDSLIVEERKFVPDGEVITAAMTASYLRFKETFTSRVTLKPEARTILVEYIEGPFRSLENRWTFLPAGEGACEIDFFIAYEFRSKAMQLAAGLVFDRAFAKFVDAFEARADKVYGQREAVSLR